MFADWPVKSVGFYDPASFLATRQFSQNWESQGLSMNAIAMWHRDLQWEDSDHWRAGETFDPHRDYDGDGASTIAEALAGTNPFDPQDVLRITAFARAAAETAPLQAGGSRSRATGPQPLSLTFDAIGGRSYTVYLLPSSPGQAFFRIRAE